MNIQVKFHGACPDTKQTISKSSFDALIMNKSDVVIKGMLYEMDGHSFSAETDEFLVKLKSSF